MERLSLKRLRGGGFGRGSSFTADPGKYAKKGSGYGHSLHGAPFQPSEPGIMRGGSYIGDFE